MERKSLTDSSFPNSKIKMYLLSVPFRNHSHQENSCLLVNFLHCWLVLVAGPVPMKTLMWKLMLLFNLLSIMYQKARPRTWASISSVLENVCFDGFSLACKHLLNNI